MRSEIQGEMMTEKSAKLRVVLTVVLAASLSCSACKRDSHSSADQLKPRTSPVQVGDEAPNFTLEDQHNQKVNLAAARGSMPTVLVFYRGYW
jgi:cytochrome oxidase Cu insertion factor (SCO1/SenC/PrrC family)